MKKIAKISLVLVAMLVAGIALFVYMNASNNKKIVRSKEELQERYDYILAHAAETPVHPLLRPIHFRVGTDFGASGTLVLSKDLRPQYIVTANHLFSETQPGSDYYDYFVLRSTDRGHVSRVVLDSLRSSQTPEGIKDVAICYLGEPGLISRTSKVRVSAEKSFMGDFKVNTKMQHFSVTAISTAEKFEVISEIVNDAGNSYLMMLYESMNGESGTGYWGDNENFYVLAGHVTVDTELREELHISGQYKSVTLLCAVKLTW